MNIGENKKEYEMPYFLTADTSESNIDETVGKLNLLITESGGENITSEAPKRKRLSYEVKKQSEAYFGVAYFNIDAEGLLKIKKTLALNKKFLRYMILNKPIKPKSAAIPVKSPDEPIPAPAQSFDQKLENILNR